MRKGLAAIVAATLCACGGGESPQATERPAEVTAASLLVVGNSITLHGPIEGVWASDWGMAASSADKDFAHLTAQALALSLTVIHASQLERDATAPIPALPVTPSTVVVVQLGDNGLPPRYAELIAAAKGAAKLACVSTWWQQPTVDAVVRAECEKAGGRYVYIGDLYPGRQDDVGRYPTWGVDAHPHDWGMARIAERVTSALKRPAFPA